MTTFQNLEAEERVINLMLRNEDSVGEVFEVLTPDQFYDRKNEAVVEAIQKLYAENSSINEVTVIDKLESLGRLEDAGGRTWVHGLCDEEVDLDKSLSDYIEIVREKYLRRRLDEKLRKVNEENQDPEQDASDVLNRAQSALLSIGSLDREEHIKSFGTVAPSVLEDIKRIQNAEDEMPGASTGYPKFDELTGGLERGRFMMLAGKPGSGKSTLAINLLSNLVFRAGQRALFFSLEMSEKQIVRKLLCAEAEVDFHDARTGFLTDEDYEKLEAAYEKLKDAPLFIDDQPAQSINDIRSKSRRMVKEKEITAVACDYAQIMGVDERHGNRERELAHIAQGFQNLFKELHVIGIVLSQLSRRPESRGGMKRPYMSDLKGSSGLEQAIDIGAFLYRAEEYDIDVVEVNGQEIPSDGVAELIVRKNREGQQGSVFLEFDKGPVKFRPFEINSRNIEEDEDVSEPQEEIPF